MIARNLIAGLSSSVWSALVGFTVIPFYLKYLGIEAYGLIGFFITIQSLFQLFDMGIAPTINREVARSSASGDIKNSATLLHSLALIYWAIGFVITIFIIAIAPYISLHWIQATKLSASTISHAVMLIGVVASCRFPVGLYQAALIGANRLALVSVTNMLMVTLSSIGAVAVLAYVSPTIEAFFIWQACIGLIYAVTIRLAAWQIIGRPEKIKFDLPRVKSVWRFTAGMSLISLMGVIFTQLDKLLLSKFLGLQEFAVYMLGTTLAGALYILISPMYNVLYPRFAALAATGNDSKLEEVYRLGTRTLAIVLFPAAMFLAVFSHHIVSIWTGDQALATKISPVIVFLVMGSALNGIMYVPHALQLAFGLTRIPIIINGTLMIFILPLTVFFAAKYGAIGAAISWFILHVLYLLLGNWLTHKKLLTKIGLVWLFDDVGIPMIIAVIIGVGTKFMIGDNFSDLVALTIGFILALLSIVIGLILSPKLYSYITAYLHTKKKTFLNN